MKMHDTGGGNVNYPLLLHQTYQEALGRNEDAQKHWQKLREEYKTLESILKDLPNELTKDVMVPVAPRALMPGKITHTNEILVCLGQGYFVKRSAFQAAAICQRREKICIDMLQSLEKERDLFIGRQELPLQQNAFGGGREIIEDYNEEEEARWRVEHNKKEREYRQQLSELREKERTTVSDEESLWKRLDELELEEELEEELDRLHAENSDEEEEEIDEEEGSIEDTEKEEQKTEEKSPVDGEVQISQSLPPSRRVSFAALEDDGSAEELKIVFHHSNNPSSESTPDLSELKHIQSPRDIYIYFKNQFVAEPKSILKKTSSYDNVIGSSLNDQYSALNEESSDEYEIEQASSAPQLVQPPVLDVVVERNVTVSEEAPTVKRPMSRFKALRQQKKR